MNHVIRSRAIALYGENPVRNISRLLCLAWLQYPIISQSYLLSLSRSRPSVTLFLSGLKRFFLGRGCRADGCCGRFVRSEHKQLVAEATEMEGRLKLMLMETQERESRLITAEETVGMKRESMERDLANRMTEAQQVWLGLL